MAVLYRQGIDSDLCVSRDRRSGDACRVDKIRRHRWLDPCSPGNSQWNILSVMPVHHGKFSWCRSLYWPGKEHEEPVALLQSLRGRGQNYNFALKSGAQRLPHGEGAKPSARNRKLTNWAALRSALRDLNAQAVNSRIHPTVKEPLYKRTIAAN